MKFARLLYCADKPERLRVTGNLKLEEEKGKGNKEDEEDCTCADSDVRWCLSDGDA